MDRAPPSLSVSPRSSAAHSAQRRSAHHSACDLSAAHSSVAPSSLPLCPVSLQFALPHRTVFEATLAPDGHSWFLSRSSIALASDTTIFAPANLRCTVEDAPYRRLVDHWLAAKYTLRYSGGLVPDFYHALIKGQGVFVSPTSPRSPAKLRMMYECAALAFIAVQAQGAAVDQNGNDLAEVRISSYDQRSGLVIGSRNEVERYKMFRSKENAAATTNAAATPVS